MTRQEIKAFAKEKIKNGNWYKILGAAIIAGIISAVTGSIKTDNELLYLIVNIISMIITAIIDIGLVNYMVNLITDQERSYELLFSKFKYWKNIAITYFWQLIKVFLWTLVFIIPGIIKSYAYSLVPYILNDNPEIDPKEAIALSEAMMQGHKGELFLLQLSFIGWSILGAFTLGILYLWLIPYMQTAMTKFLYEIKTNYENANKKPTEPINTTAVAA